jgi:uncharacterized protein YaiE (UPF0345 family)
MSGSLTVGSASIFLSTVTANGGVRTTSANGSQDTDGTRTIGMFSNFTGATAGIGTISNHDLGFYTNTTERMRIASGGNVGIGNTNPLTKFHVTAGDASSSGRIRLTHGTSTSQIELYTEPSGLASIISTNSLSFETSGSERMRLDMNGSLLLGTASSFDSNYYGNIIHVLANENAAIRHRGAFNIANAGSKTLFGNNGSLIFVAENNTGDGALFHASYYSGTVTIIANPSGRFANTDTASKICVFKSAVTGTATLKNNAGSTLQFTTYLITCAD